MALWSSVVKCKAQLDNKTSPSSMLSKLPEEESLSVEMAPPASVEMAPPASVEMAPPAPPAQPSVETAPPARPCVEMAPPALPSYYNDVWNSAGSPWMLPLQYLYSPQEHVIAESGNNFILPPCGYFLQPGGCRYASNCIYSHNLDYYLYYHQLNICPTCRVKFCKGRQCVSCHRTMQQRRLDNASDENGRVLHICGRNGCTNPCTGKQCAVCHFKMMADRAAETIHQRQTLADNIGPSPMCVNDSTCHT
jgi:hypothetical protein